MARLQGGAAANEEGAEALADDELTGRHLVVFPDSPPGGPSSIDMRPYLEKVGLTRAVPPAGREYSSVAVNGLRNNQYVVFERLGVALIRCSSTKLRMIESDARSVDPPIRAVEPERLNKKMCYRDPLCMERFHVRGADKRSGLKKPYAKLQEGASWGLQATRVMQSPFAGKGVSIAILDTGLDVDHPDFAERKQSISLRSFTRDGQSHDDEGHGTIVAGIVGGPRVSSSDRPRFAVAYASHLCIAKVLDQQGVGPDGAILAGLDWAIENKCQVVCLALGGRGSSCGEPSIALEAAALRALKRGVLIVAAAGNDSDRPQVVAPVARPANVPSILATAALDRNLRVTTTSNGGIMTEGGGIDLSAPGEDLISSVIPPAAMTSAGSTSLAAAHVAGIAALWAEARGVRGSELWQALVASAVRIPGSAQDVGVGLVQAPRR